MFNQKEHIEYASVTSIMLYITGTFLEFFQLLHFFKINKSMCVEKLHMRRSDTEQFEFRVQIWR